MIAGGSEEDEEEWIDDAVRRLAIDIARRIRRWLGEGLMLERKGGPLRPEDIMILVKRRGDLASLLVAMLRELKIDASVAAVEPLPFVPAINTEGTCACGSPSAAQRVRMCARSNLRRGAGAVPGSETGIEGGSSGPSAWRCSTASW